MCELQKKIKEICFYIVLMDLGICYIKLYLAHVARRRKRERKEKSKRSFRTYTDREVEGSHRNKIRSMRERELSGKREKKYMKPPASPQKKS